MRKLTVNHLNRRGEAMIVDNFAGGGGASKGIEMALGRSPDVAINHDAEAIAMHKANHPRTRHYPKDVFEIDPRVVCRDKPVGLAWFSPDCTFFSKARGEKPIRDAGRKSRGLAWVVTRWAEKVRPRVIILENVEEFEDWGPLLRDGKPCPLRKGQTFRKWVRSLTKLGYVVECRQLRACDYGSPTIRKRLFVIARCDGKRIRWPNPTHADPKNFTKRGKAADSLQSHAPSILLPWRTAAEIIDWSIPCPSIFLTPAEAKLIGCKRPLKDSTLRRIARGLQRFVIDNPKPFIVPITHSGSDRTNSIDDPLRTVTTAKRGEFSLVTPYIETHYGDKNGTDLRINSVEEPLRTQPTENRFGIVSPFAVPRYSEAEGQLPRSMSIEQPSPTVVPTGNGASLVSAFMAQHNSERNGGIKAGREAQAPLSTIVGSGGQQQIVAAPIVTKWRQNSDGHSIEEPLHTITASHSNHHPGGAAPIGIAAAHLSHLRTSNTAGGNGEIDKPFNALTAAGNHIAHVMAFLEKYYSSGGQHAACSDPMHTLTAKARMGLVTVQGIDYQIVDIGMRMLSPRELFSAQGFPPSYRIDIEHNGRRLPKSAQVRMCGNSVCPQVAAALVKANCPDLRAKPRKSRERQLEIAGV